MEFQVIHNPIVYLEKIENKNGTVKVLDTYINLKWLLEHFGASIRNNLMKRKWEINIPGHYIFEEDGENSGMAKIDYLATINYMPTSKKLPSHIKTIAEENNFHPIGECIIKKPWDKEPRLDKFIATLKTPEAELAYKIIKTWMVSAIAAIFKPKGHVCHGVLVLQGKQKIGKTGWIKSLDPINCDAIKEGAHLDPSNKDDVLSNAAYWIVELGELDSTFKKDIARLKSFITSSSDHIRNPYAQKFSHYYRRTVYAGSVNSETYLVDETGNRRWWTVPVTEIDFSHSLDMQQVWAEVYNCWIEKFPTDLSDIDQELVNKNNENFEKVDNLEHALLSYYDWESPADHAISCIDILRDMGWHPVKEGDTTKLGIIISKLNNGRKPPRTTTSRLVYVPTKRIKCV